MEHQFSPSFTTLPLLKFLVIFLFSLPVFASGQAGQEKIFEQIRDLNRQFRDLSSEVDTYFNTSSVHKNDRFEDFGALKAEIAKQENSNRHINGLRLIMINLELIKQNIDNRAVFEYLDTLFKYNQWNTAIQLYEHIKSEGDRSLVSSASFRLAKYYLKTKEWQKCINTLDGISADLTFENGNYALLIHGVALQKLKQHRKAIELYKKIPPRSKYYVSARLNGAISMLRQGWWTDAQYEIKEALNNPITPKTDDEVNRLYMVMGYLLLNNEYYRDSREAFRNVGLDSQYTNRSLLGIALTATSQEDFLSGLNALSILKSKNTYDLSVDEAYLILPYVYEKLKQDLTASASYTEAMDYYTNRIDQLEKIITSRTHQDSNKLVPIDNYTFSINNNILIFNQKYPESVVDDINSLSQIRSLLSNSNARQSTKLVQKTDNLTTKYRVLFNSIIESLIKDRIEYLKDYMNQSRYGLARLYDNSITGSN